MPKQIAFCVDIDSKIGTGHFARCHVLAQACERKGWKVIWVTASRGIGKFFHGPKLKQNVVFVPKRFLVHGSLKKIQAHLSVGSVVVLDGYHFNLSFEKKLVSAGFRVVTIDDNAKRRFASHWVLNGNVHAEDLSYRGEKHTRFVLGPKYFIFSDELMKAGRNLRVVPTKVKRIFVTMGGADPSNQTLKILKALASVPMRDVSVTVVAGAANKYLPKLSAFARKAPFSCRILKSTMAMGREMARADLGISSAGRVATEMLYMGLPGLKVVLADNQLGLIRKMHRTGAAINLGWCRKVTAERIARNVVRLMGNVALRRKMRHKGRLMVDGKGTQRIMKILENA